MHHPIGQRGKEEQREGSGSRQMEQEKDGKMGGGVSSEILPVSVFAVPRRLRIPAIQVVTRFFSPAGVEQLKTKHAPLLKKLIAQSVWTLRADVILLPTAIAQQVFEKYLCLTDIEQETCLRLWRTN